MAVDQNFPKVKNIVVTIFLVLFIVTNSVAEKFNFKKIIDLKSPWGSTFINNKELLITEKSGSIKLINLNTK